MRKVPYINLKELTGFYTPQSVARMFRLTIPELAPKGKQYGIQRYWDDTGHYLLDSSDIEKLHYMLYHESRGKKIPDNRRDTR